MKEDTSPHLLPKGIKYVQSVVGTFLYYARAIDCTMLPALAQIATQQAQPTQRTLKSANNSWIMLQPTTMLALDIMPVI